MNSQQDQGWEFFNKATQRKQWREAQLAEDVAYQALRRLRILCKTMVNEARFKRKRQCSMSSGLPGLSLPQSTKSRESD